MASIWEEKSAPPPREALVGEQETEVAIIGGGLTGVLTAYRLKERGVPCCILEAGAVGSGTTAGSTGKVTAQHGLCYVKLIKSFGRALAAEYAQRNSRAVGEYAALIERERIDCDFVRCSAYVYSRGGAMAELRDEVEAAKRLGIDAMLSKITKLPFETEGAVCFPDQARFDPLAFTRALAAGLSVYERSRVLTLEEGEGRTRLFTAQGAVLTARHVVFACRYPFVNVPGYYFLRMSQQRSYAIAVTGAPALGGVYVDAAQGGLSLRSARWKGGDALLLAAFDVRSGKNAAGGKYHELLARARGFWQDCELVAQWSAQDCRTADEFPYIGRYSEDKPNWYVATGFNKWGVTSAMVAAGMIADMIEGADMEASIYRPSRFALLPSAKNLAGDVGESIAGLTKEFLLLPEETLATLARGTGGIVEHEGEKYAVYRDESGTAHVLPSRCPHLGCRLEWNADDHAWECPCHGSRFDIDGRLLSGPAVKDLREIEVRGEQ